MKMSKKLYALVFFVTMKTGLAFSLDECHELMPICTYPKEAACLKFKTGQTAWACIDTNNNGANSLVDAYSKGLRDGAAAPSPFSSFMNGFIDGADREAQAENLRLQNELLRQRLRGR